MKDKIGLLTETVERYRQMENTMQKSIDIARQTADDTRRNAEAEAEAIINKAKLDAAYLSRQIDEEHTKRHQQMLALQNEIEMYKNRIKTNCNNVISMIDNLE